MMQRYIGAMPNLLYIEASPRGAQSTSTTLAEAFLRTLPNVNIDHLQLWREPLPEFDGAALEAKYARLAGKPFSTEQGAAWTVIESLVDRIRRADRLLIATPMWNFGIPYKLKHYIDLITQPGLSFSFDPAKGYAPLLPPLPVTAILASAGDYLDGPSWGRPDLASPYLRAALGFIGLEVEIVLAGPTVGDPAGIAAGRTHAEERLAAIGREIG